MYGEARYYTHRNWAYPIGIYKLKISSVPETTNYVDGNNGLHLILDTSLQSSYHSNELESRPKTKFFSLMIYAGYPA